MRVRVRTFLASREMTQADLAAQLGISPSHLSEILNGKETASLDLAVKLEDITGIPARDFAEVA